MCTSFTCITCNQHFLNRCKEVAFETGDPCDDATDLTEAAPRCEACITISGVIEKLRNLVYQAPFLETDGLSGLENLPGWQRDDYKDILSKPKDHKGWEDKAESRAERHNMVAKMKAMGLSGLEDERAKHQGYSLVLTPGEDTGHDKENRNPAQNGW